METKINNKIYYELICDKCNITFKRRKDEFQKSLNKCNNIILCSDCMRARKYEDSNLKVCSKCKQEKELSDFYKRRTDKRSYCSQCKTCMNQNNKRWQSENKGKVRVARKKWKEKNKKTIKIAFKEWKKEHKEQIKKNKMNSYHKNKENKIYRLKLQTRNLIFKSFERKGFRKDSRTEQVLGCDYETFIKHLLQTYKDNYGVEWDKKELIHIDHIIPISTAKSEEEVIRLNHYTNLQLLKAEDNLHKSNKIGWKLGD